MEEENSTKANCISFTCCPINWFRCAIRVGVAFTLLCRKFALWLEAKNHMDRESYKASFILILLIGGMLWWIHSGFSLLIKVPVIELYVASLRGHEFFSVESTILVALLAFLLVFPVSVWFIACIIFFSRGGLEKTFIAKSIGWAVVSPVLFLGLMLILFLLRVITSIAGWLVSLFLVLVIVFYIVSSLIKLILKKQNP